MRLLVTGGAGYIGSVVSDHLLRAGHEVTILDNLSHGHLEAVPQGAEFIEGDIKDKALLNNILSKNIDCLLHFAAFIEAGESMHDPDKYIENNVIGSHTLFSAAVEKGIGNILFSSTAAVYAAQDHPLSETDPINPANVYGETKHMIERLLYWYHVTRDTKVCVLRYFNAAGASLLDQPPVRGEAHEPETHIIPNILRVAQGKKDHFSLFGTDYPTPDGTCIRDYIHIDDLAIAHILGMEKLVSGEIKHDVFNLGNGQGFSNQQVLEAARQVTGHDIPVKIEPRRPGDAARLVASSQKAKEILGWQPQHTNLPEIIESAWAWHQKSPDK
jgi:UDP-glucose 4-epimerase